MRMKFIDWAIVQVYGRLVKLVSAPDVILIEVRGTKIFGTIVKRKQNGMVRVKYFEEGDSHPHFKWVQPHATPGST